MSELKGACIIGQSGGPTSVINASAYGVIRTALDSGCITNVYGAEHGIKGVLEDRLFDMSQDSRGSNLSGCSSRKARTVPVMARRRSESMLILQTESFAASRS